MSECNESSSESTVSSNCSYESNCEESEKETSMKMQFTPYEGEPLADACGHYEDSSEDEGDLDGLRPSVLEKRFDKTIPLQEWCSCGNCAYTELVSAREYRCCKEIIEATGKFTFIGLDADCILRHPDFSAMTNSTVLREVGPLLRNKNGNPYKLKRGAENSFLRAVSYRWLSRWIFGLMGWENTRPLSACIYHFIRRNFKSSDVTGYIPGNERADKD